MLSVSIPRQRGAATTTPRDRPFTTDYGGPRRRPAGPAPSLPSYPRPPRPPAPPGSARLGSARLGPARLGPVFPVNSRLR